MTTRTGALAAAAASLFLAGTLAALAPAAGAAEEKVKCEGVNSCKGHGECSGVKNECAGHNECKGKGFLMLTPEECEAAKARMQAEDE